MKVEASHFRVFGTWLGFTEEFNPVASAIISDGLGQRVLQSLKSPQTGKGPRCKHHGICRCFRK